MYNKDMPSMRISNWHYIYVLLSEVDNKFYIGQTSDLYKRLKQHNASESFSTKGRAPFKLIYSEVCLNDKDAKRREGYLKTTQGHRFIKLRLREYLKLKNY